MPPKAKTTTANTRSVKWCYTLNNPVQPVPWNELTQVYHVYGEEIGENGSPPIVTGKQIGRAHV